MNTSTPSTPSSPLPQDLAVLCRSLARDVMALTAGVAALAILWKVLTVTG